MPSASQIAAAFRRARRLKFEAPARIRSLLSGANIALVRPRGLCQDESELHRAVDALGGNAVSIEFDEAEAASAQQLAKIARVFGRLYDAIDCTGMAPETVGALATGSGVPVFCALGCTCHPIRGLAALWTIEQALERTPLARAVDFTGDKALPPAPAFLAAARALGFEVQVNRRSKGAVRARVHVDASKSTAWALWVDANSVDADARSADCRHLIQAVLMDAIDRG